MLLVYITKPDVVYDNERKEFRQFGTTDGKTLLPIYIVGILMAIILYVFFHYLALRHEESVGKRKLKVVNTLDENYLTEQNNVVHTEQEQDRRIKYDDFNDKYQYYLQQQQIQQLQNQMNQIVQNQMNTQLQTMIQCNTKQNNQILPNNLSV